VKITRKAQDRESEENPMGDIGLGESS